MAAENLRGWRRLHVPGSRWRVLGLIVCTIALGLAVGRLRPVDTAPPHRINRASFEQVEADMTEGQVEALLGGPPGVYACADVQEAGSDESAWVWLAGPPPRGAALFLRKEWWSDEGHVSVCFRPRGGVVAKGFRDVIPCRRSLAERVREWWRR